MSAIEREKLDCNELYTYFLNNQWNHIAIIRRDNKVQLYLNGSFLKEKTLDGGATGAYGVDTAATTPDNSTQLTPEDYSFVGYGIDDIATWMSALSDNQIAEIHTQGHANNPISALTSVVPFRSVQSGAWSAPATWLNQPVADATAYVQHDVTLATAVPTIGTVNINSNATLSLSSGASLATTTAINAGSGGTVGRLIIDGGTIISNAINIGASDGNGTLLLTNNATYTQYNQHSLIAGSGSGNTATVAINGSTVNGGTSDANIFIATDGGSADLTISDSTILFGKVFEIGSENGDMVTAEITDSTIYNDRYDGGYFRISAATSIVTFTDSTLDVKRDHYKYAGMFFASADSSYCVITNNSSTIRQNTSENTGFHIGNGKNSRTYYTQSGSSAALIADGPLQIGAGSGSYSEIRQLDGQTTVSDQLQLAFNDSATVNFILSGGTLSAKSITAIGNGKLIFDGGTFKASAQTIPAPFGNRTIAEISVGKQAVIDTNGRDLNFYPGHAPEGAGGLTKVGTGSLHTTGAYSGTTVVSEGTLTLLNSIASTEFSVAEGAVLQLKTALAAPVTALDLQGSILFGDELAGAGSSAAMDLSSAVVSSGANARIGFLPGYAPLPGRTFTFLRTGDTTLGALALAAENVPSGWEVVNSGSDYILQEIAAGTPPLSRTDLITWITRDQIEALPLNTVVSQVGEYIGTGVVVSNAPRNDAQADVQAIYFNGAADQAMHGPQAPASITSNNVWSAAMWVWSDNRVNHEPTVVCWGMRKGEDKQNCSLNHASTESRAASFYGFDPKYSAGAPALDSWQHIVFSYNGSTSAVQGLTVFVNGEEKALDNTEINNLIIPNDSQSILLGNQHDDTPYGTVEEGRPYQGFIGELMIFDGEMSESEALTLYSQGRPIFVGSSALPDEDQVFETQSYHNWMDADGWRNGAVPFGNNALVTGAGVSADVNQNVLSFLGLTINNGANVNVDATTFRPDGSIIISNSASMNVLNGALVDPASKIEVKESSSLQVSGENSKIYLQALDNPLSIGCESAGNSSLTIQSNALVVIPNSNAHISYNSLATPGSGSLEIRDSRLELGSDISGKQEGTLTVGYNSGTAAIATTNARIDISGDFNVARSAGDGDVQASLIIDDTTVNLLDYYHAGTRFFRVASSDSSEYRSLNRVNPCIIRNKSAIIIDGHFVLGDRNAASYYSGSMIVNDPTVMILDDSLIESTSWSSVGLRNGLATLVITNNAVFTKVHKNHFRIGADGNASKPSNAYAEGRVHVSTGGILDVATNELLMADSIADTGYLTIADGGTVKTHSITGSGQGAIIFDGGTLEALRSSTDYITCAAHLLINAGKSALINDNGFDLTITKQFGGMGGISKQGTGTLTLAALSTNSGPVSAEAGTLRISDGAGVGGTLHLVTNATTQVVIGSAEVADTVSLGALHLESDFALEIVSPGICDKLILTGADGITTEPDATLLLDYEIADLTLLFGDPFVKYTVATTPSNCLNPPMFANTPAGWYVRAKPNGDGTTDHILSSTAGTLIILR